MASLKGMRLCSDRLYRIVSTSNVNVEFHRRMSSTSTFVSNKLLVSRCCFSLSSPQSFSTKNQILFQNAKPKQESTLTHSKNDAALQTSFAKKGFICIFSNSQQFNGFLHLLNLQVVFKWCEKQSSISQYTVKQGSIFKFKQNGMGTLNYDRQKAGVENKYFKSNQVGIAK